MAHTAVDDRDEGFVCALMDACDKQRMIDGHPEAFQRDNPLDLLAALR